MSFIDMIMVVEQYPATVAAIVAVVAVIVAVHSNVQSRWQYRDSIQPQLSMSLIEQDYSLYLQIKNTGGLPVKETKITVKIWPIKIYRFLGWVHF